MQTVIRGARAAWRATWLGALAAAGLAGCGGSGSSAAGPSPAQNASDTGTLLVSVTDADGDFISYSVDVLSVILERRGGATVEVLPARTRIDFAQLTDLADLLAVATLTPGDIAGGIIRLDYGTAEVFVEQGGQVVRADVVGADGQPLGVTELRIELAERERLVITRGRAALLALDFDLAASHEVDSAQTPPLVTARPYIVAEVQPVTDKELRLRGALVSADVAAGTYTVDVRPWFAPQGNHGRITVHTTPSTAFEIDGVAAAGSAGLAALAQQAPGTMTVAFGTLAVQDRRFTAEIVHAGDSVSGERVDAVHGNIVARNGNRLTVKGAFAVRRDHVARLHRTAVVTVGPDTRVLKNGSPAGMMLDASALSVGQHIVAFGSFVEPATASAPAALDATNGRVRMLPTHLHGEVVSAVAGQLDLELRAIDRLGIELFDFAGTGVTAGVDADPANYEIATGSLSLGMVTPGQAAKVVGFVQPFGSGPPDFDGRTVIDHRALPAVLGIGWGAGTTTPFSSMGSTGLVLDVDNESIGERHHLRVGMRVIDLTALATPPTLAPSPERALYGIAVGRDVRLFTTFAEFSTAIAEQLSAGSAAIALVASGAYDDGTATLAARHIAMQFAPSD